MQGQEDRAGLGAEGAPTATDEAQLELVGVEVPAPRPGSRCPNPCVCAFGPGPEGATCATCRLLFAHHPGVARYYKCRLRKLTGGPGSDHRAGWPACGQYEARAVGLAEEVQRG